MVFHYVCVESIFCQHLFILITFAPITSASIHLALGKEDYKVVQTHFSQQWPDDQEQHF